MVRWVSWWRTGAADEMMSRFLLRYVARDEVGLLHQGLRGVVEVRDAVSAYEEKSPLFGLLQFRQKKVLLKYLPEGTSRLLQGMCGIVVQTLRHAKLPNCSATRCAPATDH